MSTPRTDSELDFFTEPETAETVEHVRRPRLESLRRRGGGGDARGPAPPTGLVRMRRLATLVAVVIASVVALVTGLGACQGGGDDYAGYLQQVRALGQSSSRAGAALAGDLRPSRLTRARLAGRLQGLAAAEQQAYDQAQQIRPPGPLRQIHEELLAALELRAGGLAGLGQTLATAGTSTSAVAAAADALAAQARLLTTSDIVWNRLYRVHAIAQLRSRGIALAVPRSRFVSSPDLLGAPSFARLLQTPLGGTSTGSGSVLRPGSSGAAVAAWQRRLNRWLRTQPGQTLLPTDGTFGPLTTAATEALQRAAHITADGIVGPSTRRSLTHELATP